MADHYFANVAHTGKDEKTRYTKVGIMYKNETKSGETVFNLKLDFPVGVTELVMFPPKEKEDEG